MVHLNDEQQARITQNLSAAKAILARKQTQSPAASLPVFMHGKPVSPANRNRAGQTSYRTASFKRKLEPSDCAGKGPLQDLAVNYVHTSTELPRKAKHLDTEHGGQLVSDNNGDTRILSPAARNGRTPGVVIGQPMAACCSISHNSGLLLQQGGSQSPSGIVHPAGSDRPGSTLQSTVLAGDVKFEANSIGDTKAVDLEGHIDRQQQTVEMANSRPTAITAPEIPCMKSSTDSTYYAIDFDAALVEEIDRICDQKVQCSTGGMGSQRKSSASPGPQMLWEDFDEDSLREIDRLCGEREKVLTNPIAEKLGCAKLELPSAVAHDRYDALGKGPSSGKFTKPSLETRNLVSRQSAVLGSDGALGPESVARPSTMVPQAFEQLDVQADVVKPAKDVNTALDDDGEPCNTEDVMGVSRFCEAEGMSELPAYLQTLNTAQKEAALCDSSKPLLILAGPGSGKTSTMVARLLSMLKEGVHPSNILAMTFTTAAATEMRERVGMFVGKKSSKELVICTFHSFCLQLCREHAEKLGRTPDFIIYGHGQQRRAVIEATRLALSFDADASHQDRHTASKSSAKMAIEDESPGRWKEKAKKWQKFVTQSKAAGRSPEDCKATGNLVGAEILKQYEATLASCNALDYHDFIIFAVKLLKSHPGVLEDCQKLWTHLLVDEFQDTSAMQYNFLKLIASHNRITVVGDDDQSIFGFNGANSSGFERFRKDFPSHSEIRLHQNYRSTRCIVEAAHSVIKNNVTRCPEKHAFTDNVLGDRIVVKECRTEAAQCGFVVDTILMIASATGASFDNTAILYRRQVTGKAIQAALRARKIPFNVHGVAFYRRKVVKNVISMLQTVVPGSKDIFCRRIFKALYASDKEETKKVLEHVDKVATVDKQGFRTAAQIIFGAKLSGTLSRRQLALGRKVLSCIQTVNCLVQKERSLSAVITAVINLLPQRPNFESRAILNENGGRLLNEDYDSRTVADYFLDDVNDFLMFHFDPQSVHTIESGVETEGQGSVNILQSFLDYVSAREAENFRLRREENKNSVTLTTMHQSKGLEWDNVYIVKANDSETPLLHEAARAVDDSGAGSLEEERRLFYVAMTRARKKLYICYIVMDLHRQLLQPSRFIREIPPRLINLQRDEELRQYIHPSEEVSHETVQPVHTLHVAKAALDNLPCDGERVTSCELTDLSDAVLRGESEIESDKKISPSDAFLKGFSLESRSTVAGMFHAWAKRPAFQEPSRLLRKVACVIDERLRNKGTKNKDLLYALKCSLCDEEALSYASHVINWTKLPQEDRVLLQAERQEHFQHLGTERSMSTSVATAKQKTFLKSLGCTVEPTSRLHASRLIEQYKKL